ncbi:Digeranylgeranylglycerophospholipid reductase [Candidatus Burarchaeum australiense]|nr:Digeranylgeranylglycerophospholipid reductase [Candidatus Burarchaeum australiense]
MLDGTSVMSRLGGVIPGRVRYQTVERKVMLVGDAAGQTKATTGGGIYFGSMCGRLAGEIAARAKREDELAEYEKEWRARYGRDLMLHRRLRDFADNMDDGQLAAYATIARGLGAEHFLAAHGDMDSPDAMLASFKKSNPLAHLVTRLFG